MPIKNSLELYRNNLFSSVDEMHKAGIAEIYQNRLIRLRDIYNYWLQFPAKRDMDVVDEIMHRYDVGKSAAYEDIRIIKALLGDLNQCTKEYHRYKFNRMIEDTFDTARRIKDAKAMASAANYYGKYNKLDKEEAEDKGYDKIIVQPFEPTEDPSVIGIKAIPNLREKIKSKIEQYWSDDIEDVSFEEAEYSEDEIFKPQSNETVSQ